MTLKFKKNIKRKNTCIFIPLILMLCFGFSISQAQCQSGASSLGAWYMYFWNTKFNKSQIGLQGDIQHRNWNIGGDLEQLLIRGGVTYVPKDTKVKFTLGYADITTGTFGNSTKTKQESRVYQEVLIPQKIGNRTYLNHRFRYEQRWVAQQNFRTRYRYNLFLNFALNAKEMKKKTLYLALYNELFINGQKKLSTGQYTEIFDRNRLYGALGYYLRDNLKMQIGIMNQANNLYSKNQMQLSLHHRF